MARLLLKWGTVKGWEFEDASPKAQEMLKSYLKNSPMSCMADHPTDERKKLLCDLIDEFEGVIHNDWTGEDMTKKQAKEYVMEYGK